MPPRKTCRHASHTTTYDQDDVLRDEAMVSMATKIDTLIAQMAELLAKCHRIPKCEDKSSDNFANLFSRCRHRTKSMDYKRWEFRLKIDILEF